VVRSSKLVKAEAVTVRGVVVSAEGADRAAVTSLLLNCRPGLGEAGRKSFRDETFPAPIGTACEGFTGDEMTIDAEALGCHSVFKAFDRIGEEQARVRATLGGAS